MILLDDFAKKTMEQLSNDVLSYILSFLDLTSEIYPLLTANCLNREILSFLRPSRLTVVKRVPHSSSKSRRKLYPVLMKQIQVFESFDFLHNLVFLDLSYVHQSWLFLSSSTQFLVETTNLVKLCEKMSGLEVLRMYKTVLSVGSSQSKVVLAEEDPGFICNVFRHIAIICDKLKIIELSMIPGSLLKSLTSEEPFRNQIKVIDFFADFETIGSLLSLVLQMYPNYPISGLVSEHIIADGKLDAIELLSLSNIMECGAMIGGPAMKFILSQHGIYKYHRASGRYLMHIMAQYCISFDQTIVDYNYEDVTDDKNCGIIHHYCLNWYVTAQTVEYLITKCKATLNPDCENKTPLDYLLLASTSRGANVTQTVQVLAVVKLLAKYGNRVSERTFQSLSCTNCGLVKGLLEEMYSQGALTNECLPFLRTPVGLKMFLQLKPDGIAEYRNSSGGTVLHTLLASPYIGAIALSNILEIDGFRSLMDIRDNLGRVPLQVAYEVHKHWYYDELLEGGASANQPFAIVDSLNQITYVSQLEYFLVVKPNIPMARYVILNGHNLYEVNGKGDKLQTLIDRMYASTVKRRFPRRKCKPADSTKRQEILTKALKRTCVHMENYVRRIVLK